VLIAEQLMLLLLDPERGTLVVRRDDTDPDRLASAALLLDLGDQRKLGFHGGHVDLYARFPAGMPILDSVAEVIAGSGPGLPLASALDLIEMRAAPVSRALLDGLHRRDLLHRLREPSWWPWAPLTYPLRSTQARNETIATLRAGVQHAARLRGLGLLLLVDCAGRLADFLDGQAHAIATEALLSLGQRHERASVDEQFLTALRGVLLAD